MTTQEINKEIAAFMEVKYKPVMAGFERKNNYHFIDKEFDTLELCLAYCDKINKSKDLELCYFPLPSVANLELKYHTSWDWLMPVVVRIESLNFNVLIGFGNSCIIIERIKAAHKAIKFESSEVVRTDDKQHTQRPDSKIQAVYTAVVQFIQFYNKTKTETK